MPGIVVFVAAGISAGTRAAVRSLRRRGRLLRSACRSCSLNGLVYPGARDVLLPLGPLAVTREGLEFGLPIAGRVVAALAPWPPSRLSTRPDDLMEGLIERGVGPRLAFALLLAMQAIPRLGRQAGRTVARRGRAGSDTSGSLGTRTRALGPIAGALSVGALPRGP